LGQLEAFLYGKQGTFCGAGSDRDDHMFKHATGAFSKVNMSVGYGIECARIKCSGGHRFWSSDAD
jgi:hypothetical protein